MDTTAPAPDSPLGPRASATLEFFGRRALVAVGVIAVAYHFIIAPPLELPRVSVEELLALGCLVSAGIAGKLGERFITPRG